MNEINYDQIDFEQRIKLLQYIDKNIVKTYRDPLKTYIKKIDENQVAKNEKIINDCKTKLEELTINLNDMTIKVQKLTDENTELQNINNTYKNKKELLYTTSEILPSFRDGINLLFKKIYKKYKSEIELYDFRFLANKTDELTNKKLAYGENANVGVQMALLIIHIKKFQNICSKEICNEYFKLNDDFHGEHNKDELIKVIKILIDILDKEKEMLSMIHFNRDYLNELETLINTFL